MARTLYIGDTHCPFMHPKYPEFLDRVRDKHQCNKVVHIGDLVDNHVPSFHSAETDAEGAKREADQAEEQAQQLYDMFPDVKLCLGNHDRIPARKAKEAAIPARWLKDFLKAMNAPPGWKANDRWEIDGTLSTHGTTCGKNAHLALAEKSRQSAVMGHTHSFGGVGYMTSRHDIIFGLQVGCGIDCSKYAFRYGKDFTNRPTLGCGVVIDGFEAVFEPMILRNKRLRRPQILVPKYKRGKR